MKIYVKVNLIIITTVTIIIVGTFIVLGQHFDRQIENHLLTTSRAVYNNILIFRQWIAQKDGVFLKKTEDEIINPFLHHPELVTTFNDTLVLRNPAMVTRELSNLSYTMGKGFSFHLTSLKYINPANHTFDILGHFIHRSLVSPVMLRRVIR